MRNRYQSFLIIFIMGFLTLSLNAANAADSTKVSNVATSHRPTSYLLYQSQIFYAPNIASLATQTTNTPSNLNCNSNYAACVQIELVDSNDLNPSQAGLDRVYFQTKITLVNTGGYKIDYKYGYTVGGYSGSRNDRRGSFTYSIMCIPKNNVDSSAFKSANGVGPTCVINT